MENDRGRLMGKGKEGCEAARQAVRSVQGADLVLGLLLTRSLKYVVCALCTAETFLFLPTCGLKGEEPSRGCAAVAARAGLGCSSVAVSCPETAVNIVVSQCLPLSLPSLISCLAAYSLLPVVIV